MIIDDKTIDGLTDQKVLFSPDFLYAMLSIKEPEEKARMEAKAAIKAKEFGAEKLFVKVMKEYNKANEELAKEYQKAFREKSIKIDFVFDSYGKPVTSIDNFLQVLENDKKFEGLKFNLLTYAPEQDRGGKTHRWVDADDAETRRYIEFKYGLHSEKKCDDALRIVFAKNEYHPIRDMIDKIVWDGKDRIAKFLTKWTKCEDNAYTREVSRLIFAGGIHRLYNPGCKFDDMPVLIGTKQGEGKSTLVRWLAMQDEYFTEVTEFDGQRGIESLEGAWICEVGELLALTKTKEQEAVKSFLTRQNDRYRMPFDKRVTEHPRQCIFVGTTNKEQFLTDKTGNRRFYPVKVHQSGYDLFDSEEEIKADIRQCWAEAKAKMLEGKMPPYADRNLQAVIRQKQSDATEDDYRVGMIEEYLESHTEVCIPELWQKALKNGDVSKPTKKESNEIGLIMQSFEGWEKQEHVKRFTEYGVQRWWQKTSGFVEISSLEDDLPF